MTDTVFQSWLEGQYRRWQEFAPLTDRVHVRVFGNEWPPQRFQAEFHCNGLVRDENGHVVETDQFLVAIQYDDDFLRKKIEPIGLAWLLAPSNVWHPNVKAPGICLGHMVPGAAGLLDVIYQVYSILTYQNARLDDFLNKDAADWARGHQDRFPIDRRPLKRRQLETNIREVTE